MRFGLFMLAGILCWPANAAMRKRKIKQHQTTDTLVVADSTPLDAGGKPEMPSSRKMSTSAFPVQITVTGRVVQIQSDHGQLLPIYNQNGILYLTARLNKGTNWLGGLPKGHYFINNRPITIN